jgi:formylglycine-generating enzyme
MVRPTLVAALLCACSRELPPLGEVVLIVDTNADVAPLGMRLRVDVYDAAGTWKQSRDFARNAPADWPASFSLFSSDSSGEGSPRTVLVRFRAYPDGLVRDYRGERFDVVSGNPGDRVVPSAGDGTPRLHDGVTPEKEPDPRNAIDALIEVRVTPGERRSEHVTLAAECVGVMADLANKVSCTTPAAPQYPPASTCTIAPRPAGLLFEEERCVPGGTFVLGAPQTSARESSTGMVLPSNPQRVVFMPPLLVDRYEVTVGRFRDALRRGLVAREPVANNAPLGTDTSDLNRLLTWSTMPLGREDYPVVGVTWAAARAFCQLEGGDLPTEAQWEYIAAAAARANKTSYPWGQDDPSCERVVAARADASNRGSITCFAPGRFGVAPVTATESDRTPSGVFGLAGNVAEWTLDSARAYDTVCWSLASRLDARCFDDQPTGRIYRGGAWVDPLFSMFTVQRAFAPIETPSRVPALFTVGFRCVRPGS